MFVVIFAIFFCKPTVALHYNSEKLKGLLEQRWTGHLATVTAVLNSFQHITSLLQEMSVSRAHKAEIRSGIRTASRGTRTKVLVNCKDALQGMYCSIISPIVSVSNNLLMVTIKFISLCCVCQSCYAAGPP